MLYFDKILSNQIFIAFLSKTRYSLFEAILAKNKKCFLNFPVSKILIFRKTRQGFYVCVNLDVTTFLNRFLVYCQSQHNCSSSSCMCATLKIFMLENSYHFVFVSPKLRTKNKDPITMQGSNAGNPRLCDFELIT